MMHLHDILLKSSLPAKDMMYLHDILRKSTLLWIWPNNHTRFRGKSMNSTTHMIHYRIQTAYQHKYDRNTTSSSKSITRLIWAPTGAFLMLLMCWSLSVSFENLIGGEGVETPERKGFGGVVFGFCFAMLVSVDWHFSCCFLNLFKLSCNDAI